MVKQFSSELCPLDVENFQLFAVSVYFLRRGCTIEMEFGKQIIQNNIQVKFNFTIKHFLTELCALDLEKFQLFAVFPFIFFANVSVICSCNCFQGRGAYCVLQIALVFSVFFFVFGNHAVRQGLVLNNLIFKSVLVI